MSDPQEQQQQQPPCPPEEDTSIDLDEELTKLEEGIQEEQKKLKTAEVEIKEREEQIKALSALIGELDAVVDDYREKYDELADKENDYKTFCSDEKACLTNVLEAKGPEKVCAAAAAVMKEILDIAGNIEKIEVGCQKKDGTFEIGALEVEERTRSKCAEALAKAKVAFEAWKDPVKTLEARYKNLEKLKKEICTGHEAKNYAMAYYLLMFGDASCPPKKEDNPYGVTNDGVCDSVEQEFIESHKKYCVRFNRPEDYPPVVANSNSGSKIVDPGNLKRKIVAAWTSYQAADAAYNQQDAKVKGLEKELELEKARLATKKKEFDATIRRKLTESNEQQPTA